MRWLYIPILIVVLLFSNVFAATFQEVAQTNSFSVFVPGTLLFEEDYNYTGTKVFKWQIYGNQAKSMPSIVATWANYTLPIACTYKNPVHLQAYIYANNDGSVFQLRCHNPAGAAQVIGTNMFDWNVKSVKNNTVSCTLMNDSSYVGAVFYNSSTDTCVNQSSDYVYTIIESGLWQQDAYLMTNISNHYETETFNVGVPIYDPYYDIVQLVYLNHNGTQYPTTGTATVIDGWTAMWFNTSVTTPMVVGVDATIYYNWSILLTNGTWINSTMLNYTASGMRMANCTTNESLVYDIYSEEEPTLNKTANFSIELLYTVGNGTTQKSFNWNSTGLSRYKFCIYPNTVNVTADSYIKYRNESYYLTRHYLSNYLLTNISTNISVYMLGTASGANDLIVTVRDKETYNFLSSIYVQLQRNYLGEGVWRTVQMAKTDDNGKGYFKVVELTEDYRFIFTDENNNVLETSNPLSLSCGGVICDLTFLIDTTVAETYSDVNMRHTFDNVTGILTLYFDVPSGANVQVDSIVMRQTALRDTVICSASSYGSFGTQTCNLSGLTGYFVVSATETGSPNRTTYMGTEMVQGVPMLGSQINTVQEQSLWAFAIVLTFVGVGLFSPVGALLSGAVGTIIVYMFGFISTFTLSIVGTVIVLIAFIAYKVQD